MILLVCGGRSFGDRVFLESALDTVHAKRPVTMLVHGGAKGADSMAGLWAKNRRIHAARVDALWDQIGRQTAGPRRNEAMLLHRPEGVVAFPGGGGTSHMVRIALEAGISVWRPAKSG